MQFDPASKKLRIDAAELCHTVVNHASIDRRAAHKAEALQIPSARRVGRQRRNAAARAAREPENAHISSLFSEKVLYCCIKICIIRR